jgi:hypothetical protein
VNKLGIIGKGVCEEWGFPWVKGDRGGIPLGGVVGGIPCEGSEGGFL